MDKKIRAIQILEKIQEKYNQESESKEKKQALISFLIDKAVYSFNITRVKEIIEPERIFYVPNAPDFLRGVINLRGEILPVVDLKKILVMLDLRIDNNTRIIIVEDKIRLGFLVDSVIDIIYIPVSQIKPPQTTQKKNEVNFLKGEVLLDDKLLSILDLEKIIVSTSGRIGVTK